MEVDVKQIKKYEHMLDLYTKALPDAMRDATNRAAFAAQRGARAEIKGKMILRNKWTLQSIQVDQMTTAKPYAVLGSVAPYMETQEFGGTKRKKGKHGVPIPTSEAAGQGDAVPRTRLPVARNKMARLSLGSGSRSGSRKQRAVAAVRNALSTGNRVIYLDTGKSKGLFRVIGGTKKNSSGAKVRMIHDLSNPNINIKSAPWLGPAFNATVRVMPQMYLQSLRFHARKAGVK